MKMLVWNACGCSQDGFVSLAMFYDNLLHLDLFCFVDIRASSNFDETLISC